MPCLVTLTLPSVLVQATGEEIRLAYKRLALVRSVLCLLVGIVVALFASFLTSILLLQFWHPDRNPHCDTELAKNTFQAIQQAYSGMQHCVPGLPLFRSATFKKDLHSAVLSRPERRQAYHLECLDSWDMKVIPAC